MSSGSIEPSTGMWSNNATTPPSQFARNFVGVSREVSDMDPFTVEKLVVGEVLGLEQFKVYDAAEARLLEQSDHDEATRYLEYRSRLTPFLNEWEADEPGRYYIDVAGAVCISPDHYQSGLVFAHGWEGFENLARYLAPSGFLCSAGYVQNLRRFENDPPYWLILMNPVGGGTEGMPYGQVHEVSSPGDIGLAFSKLALSYVRHLRTTQRGWNPFVCRPDAPGMYLWSVGGRCFYECAYCSYKVDLAEPFNPNFTGCTGQPGGIHVLRRSPHHRQYSNDTISGGWSNLPAMLEKMENDNARADD